MSFRYAAHKHHPGLYDYTETKFCLGTVYLLEIQIVRGKAAQRWLQDLLTGCGGLE